MTQHYHCKGQFSICYQRLPKWKFDSHSSTRVQSYTTNSNLLLLATRNSNGLSLTLIYTLFLPQVFYIQIGLNQTWLPKQPRSFPLYFALALSAAPKRSFCHTLATRNSNGLSFTLIYALFLPGILFMWTLG